MRIERLKNRTLHLALTAVALVALAAVACNGNGGGDRDDSSPTDGSPTTNVTPGTGDTPGMAAGTYIQDIGLDGHFLDLSRQVECPLEPVQTVVAGNPTIISRIALGQFCLSTKVPEADKALTFLAQLPDTGETWEMNLEFDDEVSLWKVKDVKKIE